MNIIINKNSNTAIFKQIIHQMRHQIQQGELRDGSPLPSERKLARSLDVHRNTITKSYQMLRSEGYIDSLQGRGYHVTYKLNNAKLGENKTMQGSIPWDFLIRDEYLDKNNVYDDIFYKSYSKRGISFASGLVPPEAYFSEDIKTILRELTESDDQNIYEYSHYQGQKKLRKNLCDMLKLRGINLVPSQIQVVNETNQAIDYLCDLFINKGDVVITEEPVSPDIFRPLKIKGAHVLTVPVDDDGINADVLRRLCSKHRPKFIVVSSSYHDPTGKVMSLNRRKEILDISYTYRIPIVEEDSASEINFMDKKITSLKSLDTLGNVIYIYSFALTFAPGFRLACIASTKYIAKKLGYINSMYMVNLDSINQTIISSYIEKGYYEKNISKIRDIYKEKFDIMCRIIDEKLKDKITYERPKGGVYLWCSINKDYNLHRIIRECRKKGLYFLPGTIFYPVDNSGDNCIRLNYSYPSLSEIEKGIDILVGSFNT